MDLTIHVKVELVETPALINCFAAFCTTIERCTQLMLDNRDLLEETRVSIPVQEQTEAEEATPEPIKEDSTKPVEKPEAPAPKKYTIDDIRTACVPLIDADKNATASIQAIIKDFGVTTLMDIPEEQYPELVEKLRSLGAQL